MDIKIKAIFGGRYSISTNGKIYSNFDPSGKRRNPPLQLKTAVNAWGYESIVLRTTGKLKCYMIHRLMAESFIKHYIGDYDIEKIAECKKCSKILGNVE